jgi:drug/metabolite transporter (DMT)-like permease
VPAAPPTGLAARHPLVPALVGAACISSSAVVVQLSHSAAGTTAFFRCALALPGLALLAWWERRHSGARTRRQRLQAVGAGAFLGTDLVLWAHSIYDVGAGVATVLGNLQVLFVAVIAWCALGERPTARFLAALPVVVSGIVLVSGLVGGSHFGHHPLAGVAYGLGTSMAYAVFIVVLRQSTRGSSHVASPLAEATLGAAASSLVLGLALGQLDLAPRLGALAWFALLALVSQTLGWLLITSALPHLAASLSSLLLLLQPAAALALAAAALSQAPSAAQLAGAALVCAGVLYASRPRAAVPGGDVLPGAVGATTGAGAAAPQRSL